MPSESNSNSAAIDGEKEQILQSVLNLVNLNDDAKAIEALSSLSAGEMTRLVREASDFAFRLDLQERVEQVRAHELGMLEDDASISLPP
mmetsp:Transcript_11045/g.22808  ORF Transcript_11045/g.22808 Transcript_11045/m.22808 type:complete len:89 (+) Transcript_11045:75-341(+)